MLARWTLRQRRRYTVYLVRKWRKFDASKKAAIANATDEIAPADQLALLLFVLAWLMLMTFVPPP